jgi:hypothetical protein
MIGHYAVVSEDSTCATTAFRKTGSEHRVWLACRGDGGAEEKSHEMQERWRLGTNGTRLQILEQIK